MINRLAHTFTASMKWLAHDVLSRFSTHQGTVHILFCAVDHYEPGTGNVSTDIARKRVESLLTRYPMLADKHRDAGGYRPKRTWFFPPHYHQNFFLRDLVSLCEKGYGEIELHLHHGKSEPDTAENLENTIKQCILEYSEFGIFGTQNGDKKYAFIHGDWALANSRNGMYCGVDNEIEILLKTGCFADLTLPTPHTICNPRSFNSIYYTLPKAAPKSYNSGISVKASGDPPDGLMIIQGPTAPFLKNNKIWNYRIYGDGINPLNKRRIDMWVRTGIGIEGNPNVIIIKTHMHGATEENEVLGDEMDSIFSYLEEKYNDGQQYKLHYVSARELYNIIKCIEAGEEVSDPDRYRDYLISHPLYNSRVNVSESSSQLKHLLARSYRG